MNNENKTDVLMLLISVLTAMLNAETKIEIQPSDKIEKEEEIEFLTVKECTTVIKGINEHIAESELLSRGWTLESSDDESSEFEKNRCAIRIWDFEEKDDDRIAYSIMFSDNILKGNYSCSCVNEISLINSTKDDVIAAFGEPDEVVNASLATTMIYYESPSTAMEEKNKVERTNGRNNISFAVNNSGVMFEVLMKRPEDMPQ